MARFPGTRIRSIGTRMAGLLAVITIGVFARAAFGRGDLADGAPIPVRWPEGMLHGFLVLKSESGTVLAQGDLLQIPRKDRIDMRMTFRFSDGSLLDERVVFSQRDVFTVHEYHWKQKGPAFHENAEASFDRATGKYRVTTFTPGDDDEPDVKEGTIELPADVYNGMAIVLAKNLAPNRSATVHVVAFTPSPRIIELAFTPVGSEKSSFGPETKATVRYELQPKLGFLLGIGAKLLGKTPTPVHAWIVTEDVPAFAKFVGPLNMSGTGAVWRIELTSPAWGR